MFIRARCSGLQAGANDSGRSLPSAELKPAHGFQKTLVLILSPSAKDLRPPLSRGHKRKLDEAQEEERGEDEEDSKDEQGGASGSPSKEEDQPVDQDADNEDDEEEEGSSSEADEMAAALDLELNDFM
ncbi:unnamed protein product [Boreogadus saida]